MPTDCEFYADPLCQGRVTPRALMEVTGTISVPLISELFEDKAHACVTRLAGYGWFFNIGYTGGKFVVQRNGAQVTIDREWCRQRKLPEVILVSWTLNALVVSFGSHSSHWDHPQIVEYAPIVPPPPELVKWVRGRELSTVEIFDSEEEFLVRVHSALQRFEERFRQMLTGDIFWDVERRGNKVVSRRPKREVEVQSALHALLVDQMQLSNIDVFREVRSPGGAVDFLMSSITKRGTSVKICLEFKNAHSPDLVSGLTEQLRKYMRTLEVQNGGYCVLDYRNAHFREPKSPVGDLMAALFDEDKPHAKWPGRPVKIHWLNIGAIGD